MDLGCQLARGGAVVAERLLDDDATRLRQALFREPLHDPAEEERRDLEVEDRGLRTVDRLCDALVGGVVSEVAGDVREPVGEAIEDLLVDRLRPCLRSTRARDP